MRTKKKVTSGATAELSDAPTGWKDPSQGQIDLELTVRSLQGDRDATSSFVDRMLCIPRFLGKLDELRQRRLGQDERRDLTQEITMRVWRDRAAFTGKSRLETWMYSYVRNAYLESAREEATYKGRREDLGDHPHALGVEDRTLERVASRLDADLVRTIAADLPEAQQQVLEMKLMDGLSFSEIAGAVGSNQNTIKARYYRSLRSIKSHLDAPSSSASSLFD